MDFKILLHFNKTKFIKTKVMFSFVLIKNQQTGMFYETGFFIIFICVEGKRSVMT